MPYARHAIRAAFFAAAATTTTTAALATAPGDRVENIVTVTFEVDSVVQDPGTARVGFVVDRKIDMLVVGNSPILNGRPKQEGRELFYKVTNEGNDAQPYDIDVTLTGNLATRLTLDTNSDVLGPSEYRVYISPDGTVANGTVYDPAGIVTADTPIAFDGSVSTDDEFHVIVVVNIPPDAEDTETVNFSVRATALNSAETGVLVEATGNTLDNETTPMAAVDIVFADGPGTNGSEAGDLAEDGKHTDNNSLTVASAKLTVAKLVTIVSEDTQGGFDCAAGIDPNIDDNIQGAIPGACLQYTISVANGAAASEAAQSVSIVDALPAGLTFVDFLNKTAWSNAAYDTSTRDITAALDNPLLEGVTEDLVFRVTVD